MVTINTKLLEVIETEVIQNPESNYKKEIPIHDYNFETKRTLDVLVEKYGGFVHRYDDKIIICINYTTPSYHREIQAKHESFAGTNSIINRLSQMEEKMEEMIEVHNQLKKDTSKNVFSYMNYFQTNNNKRELSKLADEIINHHS